MALTTTTPRISYTGNGATTTFAIPFSFQDEANVKVYLRDNAADPVTETLLVDPTHYGITGSNVIMVSAPSATKKLIIVDATALEQTTDYEVNGRINVETLEETLDGIVRMVQNLEEKVSRAPKFKITSPTASIDLPEPEADASWVWSPDGTKVVNGPSTAAIAAVAPAAAAAATSATASAASATASAASATTAATEATNSATSATASAASATASAGSATTASTQAGNAATSATAAAGSATTAAGHVTTAAGHVTTASGHATTAGTHATNAGTSATAAAGSATTAAGHVTTAAGHVTTASGHATTAGTHATNAGNSATAAATSASAAAVSAAALSTAVTSKTAAYTATTTDKTILCNATSGAFTITLPAASGNTGLMFNIFKTDTSANIVTVDGNGSETIGGVATRKIGAAGDNIIIVCDGTNWHVLKKEVVSARYTSGYNTSLANSGTVDFPFATKVYDTGNNFNGTVFTAPFDGFWGVRSFVSFNAATPSVNGYLHLRLYKQAVNDHNFAAKVFEAAASQFANLFGTTQVYLLAGQTLNVNLGNFSGSARVPNGAASENWIAIDLIE